MIRPALRVSISASPVLPFYISSLTALALSHWNTAAGFYTSEKYWEDPNFSGPIMTMLKECRTRHENCGAREIGPLPTMILDVSASRLTGRVFLCVPDNETLGDYVALSYCWGGPQDVTTTIANRVRHEQEGIEVASLPCSISDAACVTAALGIQYLWVDALCIVQDDDASKALEIEKMGDIYANATLVLLAGGLSRRAGDGFLGSWDELAVVPIRVDQDTPTVPICLAPGDLETSHLDCRGWTFQERHLASRTLEFRGSRGVSFSCQQEFMTYTGSAGLDGRDTWVPDVRKLNEKLVKGENARRLWQSMLEEYTVRRLTAASDRLPAIAGFARIWARMAGLSEDEYVAGLWKGQLIDDLMWQSGVHHVGDEARIGLDQYRQPGWSWISVLDREGSDMMKVASFITNPQHIRLRLGGRDENVASLIRHSISLAHPNAPFGRVLSGEITLRAQVVGIPKDIETEKEKDRWVTILDACDYEVPAEEASRLQLLRLKVAWQWDSRRTGRAQCGNGGLLILPCGHSQPASSWRRVGCFWDWVDADEGSPLVDWDVVDFQEVTLI